MAKPLDETTKRILSEYGIDPKSALWDCHGTWVMYHKSVEQIAAKAGITFDPPQIIEADTAAKTAVVCVVGSMGERREWSFGEAAPANNKNSYPWAMAEKRAKDRVALKLVGLAGFVYSEEEADDFKDTRPKNGGPKQDEPPDEWLDFAMMVEGELKAAHDLRELSAIWSNYGSDLTTLKKEVPLSFEALEALKDKLKAQFSKKEAA